MTDIIMNPPGKILAVFLAVVALVGVWHIITGIFPMADKKSRKIVKTYEKIGAAKKKTAANGLDDAMQQLSKKLVPFVRMNSIERSEKEKALQLARMGYTPEEYVAYMLTVTGCFAGVGLLLYIIGIIADMLIFKILGAGVAILGVLSYVINNRKLSQNCKQTMYEVECELPRFVSYIVMTLENNNESILSMIERYTPARESFGEELSQTMADAKTSSFEAAMTRWDQRINSDKLRQVISGLINANEGSDVTTYFAMLNKELTSYEIVLLKQNISTIPARMRVPKMLMYLSLAVTLFFPLIMQIVESFKEVFLS